MLEEIKKASLSGYEKAMLALGGIGAVTSLSFLGNNIYEMKNRPKGERRVLPPPDGLQGGEKMSMLEEIRKVASSDQLKKVEKRLGFTISDGKAREDAIGLRQSGMSSKRVMRELLRKYPSMLEQSNTELAARRERMQKAYEDQTARLKATQMERTVGALGLGVIGAIGMNNATKTRHSSSSTSFGPDGYSRSDSREY